MSAIEAWQDGHERRCDDRQAAMSASIGEMKIGVGSLSKSAWAIAVALLAWSATQLYTEKVDRPAQLAAAATAAAAVAARTVAAPIQPQPQP